MTTVRDAGVEDAASLRATMVAELRRDEAIASDAVAAAFSTVPRHLFAVGEPLEAAYAANRALVIKRTDDGEALSSLSAAHIQAVMLEQAGVEPGMRVLEIGSGGYNAALLQELVGSGGKVISVDIDPQIVARARGCLSAAGYDQVEVVQADAEGGVPQRAPFDRIIVTAGAWDIPPAWLEQLAESGRIVVPLRLKGLTRTIAFDRTETGLASEAYRLCGFVPMQGDGAGTERRLPLDDGVDLWVEGEGSWNLTLPVAVAAEAARAANVLVHLAPRAPLSTGWAAWHGRFLERYGPRAQVPLQDAIDPDTGLGYPSGYLGTPAPAPAAITERDRKLLALAQKAALTGRHEVILDDATVAELAVVDPAAPRQPTTELTVRIHAPAAEEDGFTLSIVGVSRSAGTTTGRFLDLFEATDRERMAATYAQIPPAHEGALRPQISAALPYAATENVARSPEVMRQVLRLGEFDDRSATGRIAVDDIAVTADADRVYLVSLSEGRPVEPVAFNAVEPVHHMHPLTRFVLEATNAARTPCVVFDWGAAAGLPFLPALRYGRTVLSPARWILHADELPPAAAPWTQWDDALAARRAEAGLPDDVALGEGDQRVPLDLAEPAHRALLRTHLDRKSTAVLRGSPGSPVAWMNGHVHEVVIPLAADRPLPAPRWLDGATISGREHGHLPGCEGRFSLKLYAHPDRHTSLLTGHLPRLLTALGEVIDDRADKPIAGWFLRYRDPDDHLRLRLTVPTGRRAAAAEHIGAWTRQLQQAGLTSRVQWDTYFPETARFGGQDAMAAAEAYFAADSAAALAQLTACSAPGGPDPRAMTAASMLDTVAAVLGGGDEAMRWMIAHARTAPSAPARPLYDQAVALGNPHDPRSLAAAPEGEALLSAWAQRHRALTAYRSVLSAGPALGAAELLPELLHLHHARMAGVSAEGERTCLHLARAAALSWSARAKKEA
ncbi:protein-L-isoaspartate(D-aspartate) O-methyltransferase [Actinacidiphila yanglinensis]|uniref:Protein-L-isoaspartate O-methyltransferase n=1 Tax=Actinacidiphila yanglinensis TaxID=310779 RepID=A0A1H6ECK2_9ACTN|nr:methyltransferase, FxLD system [Actinacidiphila yanglinensis]SEG94749.1 protein-L-isoaspartate(D-aspartate) O-methyltransferase [Actinacidiphila yanglinensis]